MEEWKSYFDEGLAYCKVVLGARDKRRNFGNTVMYNLVGLALESLLTALIMKDEDLPEHSGIGSMLRMLRKKYDVPESFRDESRHYNKFMTFCSLDIVPQPNPSDEDIERMVAFMVDLRDWVTETMGTSLELC